MTRSSQSGRLFAWMMLLLGLFATALFGLGLRNSLLYTFAGQSATGKVIQFQRTSSRSASIVGQVEVAIPGRAPFRAEVEDALGSQEWSVGGEVSLRCAQLHSGYLTCSSEMGPWRLLFPVIFVGIGVAIVAWSVKRIRGR